MIKLGLLQLGFFALYIFTYKDFKLAAVKDYNILTLKIMIAANEKSEKLQIKIAKQNYYTEKRERKRYNNNNKFIYFTTLTVVIGLLQFYKFNYFKNRRWCKVQILLLKNIDYYFQSSYINSTLIYTQNYRN